MRPTGCGPRPESGCGRLKQADLRWGTGGGGRLGDGLLRGLGGHSAGQWTGGPGRQSAGRRAVGLPEAAAGASRSRQQEACLSAQEQGSAGHEPDGPADACPSPSPSHPPDRSLKPASTRGERAGTRSEWSQGHRPVVRHRSEWDTGIQHASWRKWPARLGLGEDDGAWHPSGGHAPGIPRSCCPGSPGACRQGRRRSGWNEARESGCSGGPAFRRDCDADRRGHACRRRSWNRGRNRRCLLWCAPGRRGRTAR